MRTCVTKKGDSGKEKKKRHREWSIRHSFLLAPYQNIFFLSYSPLFPFGATLPPDHFPQEQPQSAFFTLFPSFLSRNFIVPQGVAFPIYHWINHSRGHFITHITPLYFNTTPTYIHFIHLLNFVWFTAGRVKENKNNVSIHIY